jgi:indole-3-acetate monooxygenase
MNTNKNNITQTPLLDNINLFINKWQEYFDGKNLLDQPIPNKIWEDFKAYKFNLSLVEKKYNGYGASLMEAMQSAKKLSKLDTSIAWVYMVCVGTMDFVNAGLDNATWTNFSCNNDNFIVGATHPSGKAIINSNGDGYNLSGNWKYGSGCHIADKLLCGGFVYLDENTQYFNADKQPEFRVFIVDKKDISIEKTWNTQGLFNTNSHNYSICNAKIPAHNSFLMSNTIEKDGKFYYLPFSAPLMPALLLGCAEKALDFYKKHLEKLDNNHSYVQESCDNYALNYAKLQSAWLLLSNQGDKLQANKYQKPSLTQRGELRASCIFASSLALEVVSNLYHNGGSLSIDKTSVLYKTFNDISVGLLHGQMHKRNLKEAGLMLLNMDGNYIF